MDFDFDQVVILQDSNADFYEFVSEDGCKMFFPPPRRHELEIIEKHMSIGNNPAFLEQVNNPTVVFWFLISIIKNMDHSLIDMKTTDGLTLKEVCIQYHLYKPRPQDK